MKIFITIFLLIIFLTPSYAQWEVLGDVSANYGFNDVYFLNQDTGFIVGQSMQPFVDFMHCKGLIFKTTDGGLNWDTSFFSYPLGDLYFLNKDTGFLGGFAGRIYKTINGGISWDTVRVLAPGEPLSYGLTTFYFHDSDHGFASNYSGPGMLKTSDGGANWELVYNSNNQIISGNSLKFSSDSIGYCGAKWKTTDGGVDWFDISNTPFYPQIYQHTGITDAFYYNYFDDNFGFVLGDIYDNYQPCALTSVIAKTVNGGLDWDYTEFRSLSTLLTIDIIDKNVIYMAGASSCIPFSSNSVVGPYPCFIKSIDGGQKWYFQKSDLDSLLIMVKYIDFPTPDIGYATAHYAVNDTGERSLIFKTTNGGGPLYDALIPYEPEAISEESDLNSLNVYPNPAFNEFSISTEKILRNTTIRILDIQGKTIFTKYYPHLSKVHSFNISDIKPGLYFLILQSSDGSQFFSEKFIKL